MPEELEHASRLHAAYAAADNVDGLGRICFLYVVLVPLHCLCVDGAAGKMQAVGELLVVGNTLVVAHIEAAVVAENAGTDIVLSVLHHLRDPLLVGEELTRKACAVELALLYRVRGDSRVEASGADNGDVTELLDVFDILEVAVLGHIDGRVSPVPCIVGAVVAVEHIIARILQKLRGDLGLGHVAGDKIMTLSGGEQQRVALARCILKPGDLIPRRLAQHVFDEMLRLQHEYGKTLIIVTHDLGIAAQCDNTIELQAV